MSSCRAEVERRGAMLLPAFAGSTATARSWSRTVSSSTVQPGRTWIRFGSRARPGGIRGSRARLTVMPWVRIPSTQCPASRQVRIKWPGQDTPSVRLAGVPVRREVSRAHACALESPGRSNWTLIEFDSARAGATRITSICGRPPNEGSRLPGVHRECRSRIRWRASQ